MSSSKRSAEREEFWRLVLDEHRSSGLSVREFCRRERLSEPSFYAWRREILKRDSEAGNGQEDHPPTKSTVQPPANRLLPVKVVELRETAAGVTPEATPTVEVVTPNGFILRVDDRVQPSRLSALVSSIASCRADASESC